MHIQMLVREFLGFLLCSLAVFRAAARRAAASDALDHSAARVGNRAAGFDADAGRA